MIHKQNSDSRSAPGPTWGAKAMKNAEIIGKEDPRFQAFRARMLRRIITPDQRAREDRKRREASAKDAAAHRAAFKAVSLERRAAREQRAREASRVRRASDPVFTLQAQVRCLVNNSFRRRGRAKSAPWWWVTRPSRASPPWATSITSTPRRGKGATQTPPRSRCWTPTRCAPPTRRRRFGCRIASLIFSRT